MNDKIIITMDPQPTLTAIAVLYPDGRIVCRNRLLSTSRANKKNQINQWLNKTPARLSVHLQSLFEGLVELDDPIFFCIEGQMKAKCTIGLEAFIKGWMTCRFSNIQVISYPAKTWQTILHDKPNYRKSYESETWDEMCHDPNLICDFGECGSQRRHDMVDTYVMLKFVLDRHF